MKVLFLTLLSVCLLGLVSTENIWDGYLDDGVTSAHVDLDEQPNTPVYLPELSDDDCLRFNLEDTIEKFVSEDNKQTPKQQLRLRLVQYCKQNLENDVTVDLAKLDEQVKERASLLVESLTEVSGNNGYTGQDFYMPDELAHEGILKAIERSGTDLSSIKTADEFETIVGHLLKDCKQVYTDLHGFAYVYRLFLNRDFIQPDPIAAQWVKNTYVCRFLGDDYTPSGTGAYELLREKYPIKNE